MIWWDKHGSHMAAIIGFQGATTCLAESDAALQGGWRHPGFAPGATQFRCFSAGFHQAFGRFWATNPGVAERSLGGKTWNEDVGMILLIDGYSLKYGNNRFWPIPIWVCSRYFRRLWWFDSPIKYWGPVRGVTLSNTWRIRPRLQRPWR